LGVDRGPGAGPLELPPAAGPIRLVERSFVEQPHQRLPAPVERIVQPKYTLTVANNSPTDTAWVDIGRLRTQSQRLRIPGRRPALLAGFTAGILAGRLIVVRRGAAAASAYEVQRFFLYSDVNLTIQ